MRIVPLTATTPPTTPAVTLSKIAEADYARLNVVGDFSVLRKKRKVAAANQGPPFDVETCHVLSSL